MGVVVADAAPPDHPRQIVASSQRQDADLHLLL